LTRRTVIAGSKSTALGNLKSNTLGCLKIVFLLTQKNPQGVGKMRKKSKLKIYEYQEAFKRYYEEGWSASKIAKHLGRHRSTLCRLFRRDVHPFPGVWRRLTSYEKAMYCWEKYRERAQKSRKRKRLKSERIRKIVVFILCRWHWSPEKISMFLKDHGIKISGKAIYSFIKKERPNLTKYFRQRGKPRRQRVVCKRSYFKAGVPAKKSIHSRPPIVEAGHWEVDTIFSVKGSKGGVLTLRELGSKRTFYFLIPNLMSRTIMERLFPFFQALPPHMCRTLTSDNGSEFAELYKLEKVISGFSVYYCDPYKAYQRGSVENANGELRWYFPKKTDFSKVSEAELKKAEYKINFKPLNVNNRRAPMALYKEFLNRTA